VARREPAAAGEFLWYMNADIGGWPSGPAQAGEVDWALATYGAVRWAHAQEALGDAHAACTRYAAIAATWERADHAVLEATRLEARRARICR
jgi:hypothetical protein